MKIPTNDQRMAVYDDDLMSPATEAPTFDDLSILKESSKLFAPVAL